MKTWTSCRKSSTQIALAVDNAIAYGRVTEARDRLEEERLYLESEIRAEHNFEDIVGKSAALRKVLDQVAIVAPHGVDSAPARRDRDWQGTVRPGDP